MSNFTKHKNILYAENPHDLEMQVDFYIGDLIDREKNGYFETLSTAITPKGQEILILGKSSTRLFKHDDDFVPDIPEMEKPISIDNADSIGDLSLNSRMKNILFPTVGVKEVELFGPISDIHSEEMGMFVTDRAAEIIDSRGVNLEAIDEELIDMESVEPSKGQLKIAGHVTERRRTVHRVKQQLHQTRLKLADKFVDECSMTLVPIECRNAVLALEHPGNLGKDYLMLHDKLKDLTSDIDNMAHEVVHESSEKIHVPEIFQGIEIKSPHYNVAAEMLAF